MKKLLIIPMLMLMTGCLPEGALAQDPLKLSYETRTTSEQGMFAGCESCGSNADDFNEVTRTTLTFQSVAQSVKIIAVMVNQGNCPVPSFDPITLKYGEVTTHTFSEVCSILKVEVETDQGFFEYNWE